MIAVAFQHNTRQINIGQINRFVKMAKTVCEIADLESCCLLRIAQVSIKVYDVLGREAAVLVDWLMNAGEQCVTWNTEGLTSGRAYCPSTARSQTAVKKVLLVQ